MQRVNEDCLRIASSQGVPGTAGALVRDARGRLGLVTNYHVAFGGGAQAGDRVWAVPPEHLAGSAQITHVGNVRDGYMGRVTSRGTPCYVDCAFVELRDLESLPVWLQSTLASQETWPGETGAGHPGMRVQKIAAVTGRTEGILASVDYSDCPVVEHHSLVAPAQLLVRPADPVRIFFGPGDSGAALLDERGAMIGLLWGTRSGGEGIACPVAPVFERLQVSLASPLLHETRRSA